MLFYSLFIAAEAIYMLFTKIQITFFTSRT